MNEFESCPFCGSDAQRRASDDGGQFIECSRCHASTALHYERCENLESSWNERAPSPVPAPELVREAGVGLIAAERQRQMDVEGWTPEHDDEHSKGQLARAGACYIRCAHNQTAGVSRQMEVPLDWPWESYWWKPSRLPERNFVKGCALIAAEIDRLRRAALALAEESK